MPCVGRNVDFLAPGAAFSSLGRPRGGCIVVEQPHLLHELAEGLPPSVQPSSSSSSGKSVGSCSLPRCRPHPPSGEKSRSSCSACNPSESRGSVARCYRPAGRSISSEPCDESRRWLSPSNCTKMQLKSDLDFRRAKHAYDSLLQTDVNHSMDVEHFLLDREILNLRRAEMQHKSWTDNVYIPIRRCVSAALNPPLVTSGGEVCTETCGLARDGRRDVYAQRLIDYADYLTYVNKKGHVFLDICQPSEYCPPPHISAVQTPPLKDPLLAQERVRLREDCAHWACVMGSSLSCKQLAQIQMPCVPLVPAGRHGYCWNKYANMHLGDIDSPSRAASRLRMNMSRNSSQIGLAWHETFSPQAPNYTSSDTAHACSVAVQVDL